MEELGDGCGFVLTEKSVTNWRVARHGSLQNKEELQTKATDQEPPNWRVARHASLQLDEEEMQLMETDQTAHLTVYINLSEARAAERSARGEAVKQDKKKRGEERRREKTRIICNHVHPEFRPVFLLLRAHTNLLFPSSMSDDSESEEWWFEVRPKGVGRTCEL